MNSRIGLIMGLVLVSAIAAGTGAVPVSAQSCTAQLTYPVMPTVYANSNVPIVVPLSATCSAYYGNQLYATANLYDATSGSNLGSVNVAMVQQSGTTAFGSQLVFNLPSTTQGHLVQLSASIYTSQYGELVASANISFQVASASSQVTTTTLTQTAYPNQYPYLYPSPYAQYPSQFSPQYHQHQYENQTPNANNTSLLAYVVIAAIVAVVIIATVGLVAYGRRQPYWVPLQPPPPPR